MAKTATSSGCRNCSVCKEDQKHSSGLGRSEGKFILFKEDNAMPYSQVKVYSDGSHYIGIPYIPDPRAKNRRPRYEEVIEVKNLFLMQKSAPMKNCPMLL